MKRVIMHIRKQQLICLYEPLWIPNSPLSPLDFSRSHQLVQAVCMLLYFSRCEKSWLRPFGVCRICYNSSHHFFQRWAVYINNVSDENHRMGVEESNTSHFHSFGYTGPTLQLAPLSQADMSLWTKKASSNMSPTHHWKLKLQASYSSPWAAAGLLPKVMHLPW